MKHFTITVSLNLHKDMFKEFIFFIFAFLLVQADVISSELVDETQTETGCEPGWMDGHSVNLGCLKFGSEAVSYQEAHKICHEAGAFLIEIFSKGQMDFMVMELALLETLTGARFYWGGGTDMNREGQWYWSHSLIPIEEFVWARGQPDGGALSNYFVFNDEDYMGEDYPSSSFAYALCQKMS